jgi:hypothetical protein
MRRAEKPAIFKKGLPVGRPNRSTGMKRTNEKMVPSDP